MASQWYVRRNGKEYGPTSATKLQDAVAKGFLSSTDLVREDGSDDWRPAEEIRSLFSDASVPLGQRDASPDVVGPVTRNWRSIIYVTLLWLIPIAALIGGVEFIRRLENNRQAQQAFQQEERISDAISCANNWLKSPELTSVVSIRENLEAQLRFTEQEHQVVLHGDLADLLSKVELQILVLKQEIHFRDAEAFLQAGDLNACAKCLEQYLDTDLPINGREEATRLIAQIQFVSNDSACQKLLLELSDAEFEAFVAGNDELSISLSNELEKLVHPELKSAYIKQLRAEIPHVRGIHERIALELKEQQERERLRAPIALSEAVKQSANVAEQVAIAERFLKQFVDDPRVEISAAQVFLKSNDSARVIDLVESALRHHASDIITPQLRLSNHDIAVAQQLLGVTALQRKQYIEGLKAFDQAVALDSNFTGRRDLAYSYVANLDASAEALARATDLGTIDEVRKRINVSVERFGTVVLVEPNFEEVQGHILGFLRNGTVVLEHESKTTGERRVLGFTLGEVLFVYRGNEAEERRFLNFARSYYDPTPVFRDFPLAVIFYDFQRKEYRARISYWKDRLIDPEERLIATPVEVLNKWKELDTRSTTLDAPYTWTREWARKSRELTDQNVSPMDLAQRTLPYLNVPDAGIPYPKYQPTDLERQFMGLTLNLGLAFMASKTFTGKGATAEGLIKTFANLTPEEKAMAGESLKSVRDGLGFIAKLAGGDQIASNSSDQNISNQPNGNKRTTSGPGDMAEGNKASPRSSGKEGTASIEVVFKFSDNSLARNQGFRYRPPSATVGRGDFQQGRTDGNGIGTVQMPLNNQKGIVEIFFAGKEYQLSVTGKRHTLSLN